MRSLIFSISFLLIGVGYFSCTKSSGTNLNPNQSNEPRTFIPVQQANRRINSYLTSIGYPNRDEKIRSWIIDADSLRAYLQDTSIRKLKIFMAHGQEYIDSGREGLPPTQGQIPETLILTGVNRANNYVFSSGDVMDNSLPCPRMCMTIGEVGNPDL